MQQQGQVRQHEAVVVDNEARGGVSRVQDRFGNRAVAGALERPWSGQEPLIAAEVALQAAGVEVALDGSNDGMLQSWRHVEGAETGDGEMAAFRARAWELGAGTFLG